MNELLVHHGCHWDVSCAAFTGTAGLFAIQKVLQKKLPYPLQWNLLISLGEKWLTHKMSQLFALQLHIMSLLLLSFISDLLVCLSVTSSVASYAVTRWETQKCSDLWLLLETGKVPDRSPPQGEYSVWFCFSQFLMPHTLEHFEMWKKWCSWLNIKFIHFNAGHSILNRLFWDLMLHIYLSLCLSFSA